MEGIQLGGPGMGEGEAHSATRFPYEDLDS